MPQAPTPPSPRSAATELGLAAEGLLGDHRVRAGRAGVDLVVDQVGELQDVHVADRDRVVVLLTGAAVEQRDLAVRADLDVTVGRVRVEGLEDLLDGRVTTGVFLLVPVGTVEDRGGNHAAGTVRGRVLRSAPSPRPLVPTPSSTSIPSSRGGRVAEMALEDLAHVHARGHAEGVQDDVDGRPVRQERHVLDRENLGDDALVAVTAASLSPSEILRLWAT